MNWSIRPAELSSHVTFIFRQVPFEQDCVIYDGISATLSYIRKSAYAFMKIEGQQQRTCTHIHICCGNSNKHGEIIN